MKNKASIITKNLLFISGGRGLEFLLGIGFIVLIARYLGAQKFGEFAFIRSVGIVAAPLISWGTLPILIREISINRKKIITLIPNAFALHSFIAFGLLVAIIVVFQLFPQVSSEIRNCVYLVIIWQTFICMQRSILSVFLAVEQAFFSSFLDILTRFILIGMYVAVIITDLKMIGLFWAAVFAYGVGLAVSYALFYRKGFRLTLSINKKSILWLIKESYILFISQLIIQVYTQINIFLLKIFSMVGEIAFYQVPQRIIEPLRILPRSLMLAFIPTLSILGHNKNKKRNLLKYYKKIIKNIVACALPICICVTMFAEAIISILFGQEFMGAVIPLQISIWTIIFFSINVTQATILTSSNNQNVLFIGNGCCLIVNIILSVLLIPRYVAVGASVSMVCAMLCLIFVNAYFIRKRLGRVRVDYVAVGRLFFSGLGMWVMIYSLKNGVLGLILIPLTTIVYFSILFFIRFFTIDEIDVFKGMIKKISYKLGLS